MDFFAGWMFGCAAMWGYFHFAKLIRSKEEWFKATNKEQDNG